MSKENKNLSRRNFIAAGSAAAASIIAIEAKAAPDSNAITESANNTATKAGVLSNDPVYTESVQTLTNKTISSRYNTLGTEYLNVKEFPITGTDITFALDSAISALSSGGQILIPRGEWTTNGGHEITNSISIEGVGSTLSPGIYATNIKLNASQSSYMFRLQTIRQNCSLKNLLINLSENSQATGLLMTDSGSTGRIIYFTRLENVGFKGGLYGIKVDSVDPDDQFECILNRFESVSFLGCQTGFYCNTINGSYEFDNCYFSIKTPSGVAVECTTMGSLSLAHCDFVGNSTHSSTTLPTDGSVILKTHGVFNSISFFNCQDENVQYAYRNTSNPYETVAVVYRNCLLQSKFYFTANGAVLFDSCRLNVTGGAAQVKDTTTAYAKVYLKGVNDIFDTTPPPEPPTPPPPPPRIDNFDHDYSRVFYEAVNVVSRTKQPGSTYHEINATRGIINIPALASSYVVYNYLVTADSIILAQLRTYDSGGARINYIVSYAGYFIIYLTQGAATSLNIGFKVESGLF
ncbi:MAG TPA: hypothetical protein VGB02_03435 [Pyrinomonadaceae bacterium]|jgi:hypothetical protein